MGRTRHRIPRSRLPLHRRLLADPARLRRWALVVTLGVATAALTGRVLAAAEAERDRWGQTRSVLVVERAVAAGRPLAGAVRTARWPRALVPDGAVTRVPVGAVAAGPLAAGLPLTESAVDAEPLAGRVRIALPAGTARLPLEPGDRVDVWATTDPSLAEGELATRRLTRSSPVVHADRDAVVVAVTADEVADVAEAVSVSTLTLTASG